MTDAERGGKEGDALFTSNHDLVHLVFADPKDTYFGPGMLKLDLEQYLWLKLQEQGRYANVYFLRSNEKGGFRVCTLTGETVSLEGSGSFLSVLNIQHEVEQFKRWLFQRMRAKQTAAVAVVCSAEEYCRVLNGKQAPMPWKNARLSQELAELNDRTGLLVLTLPSELERSRELLLNEPVLDLWKPKHSAMPSDLLRSVEEEPNAAYTVLSPASGHTVSDLLRRLQTENAKRFLPRGERERVAAYLTRYLGSCRLQQEEALFRNSRPSLYWSFLDLYRELQNEQVWNKLVEKAAAYQADSPDNAFASVLPPGSNSIRGRCIQKIFGKMRSNTQIPPEQRAAWESISRKLLEMRAESANKSVFSKLEAFLDREISESDVLSSQACLEAARFCVDWLYTPAGSEEEKDVLAVITVAEERLNLAQNYYRRNDPLLLRHMETLYSVLVGTKDRLERRVELAVQDRVVLDNLVKQLNAESTPPKKPERKNSISEDKPGTAANTRMETTQTAEEQKTQQETKKSEKEEVLDDLYDF